MSLVKVLRVLRVLRPLRAINRAKGLKVSTKYPLIESFRYSFRLVFYKIYFTIIYFAITFFNKNQYSSVVKQDTLFTIICN